MDDLGVTTETVPGATVLSVSGEIDLHTAPGLRAALEPAVQAAREQGTAVVVDLSAVSFLDSTGLGELVGAHKALAESGERLHVVAVGDRVPRLLGLTGLTEVLAVHGSRADALADATRT